jgi:hypothetical protein
MSAIRASAGPALFGRTNDAALASIGRSRRAELWIVIHIRTQVCESGLGDSCQTRVILNASVGIIKDVVAVPFLTLDSIVLRHVDCASHLGEISEVIQQKSLMNRPTIGRIADAQRHYRGNIAISSLFASSH